MEIHRANVTALAEGFAADEREWLDDYVSVTVRDYLRGKVVHRLHRLLDSNNAFPAGLVPMVVAAASTAGVQVDVIDLRGPAPCAVDESVDLTWLRPYQLDAAMSAARAGCGLVKAPTGSGKTEVFIALSRLLPCRWLFVVHRADLVVQAAKRYQDRTGLTAGTFAHGQWKRGTGNVTVSTFQSICAAMRVSRDNDAAHVWEFLSQQQAVNVDEVHAQAAPSFFAVTAELGNAYYRFGMSATPLERGDLEVLSTIGSLGPIVYRVKTDVLVAAGVLSTSSVVMVPCDQGRKAKVSAVEQMVAEAIDENHTPSTWRGVYTKYVTRSDVRNEVVTQMARLSEKPALCFVEERRHGQLLKEKMLRAGIRAEFVDGKAWARLRGERIADLVAGRIEVLICSIIFQEGIDVPSLRSVIVASGKASAAATLQRIGRGMRVDVATSKTSFEVWDVFDRGQTWLQRHANARRRAYLGEGHKVSIGWPTVAAGRLAAL